jgi:hypothetical protein
LTRKRKQTIAERIAEIMDAGTWLYVNLDAIVVQHESTVYTLQRTSDTVKIMDEEDVSEFLVRVAPKTYVPPTHPAPDTSKS